MMQTLVLGLGNLSLADEGVGIHVAQHLIETDRRDDVVVLDVGSAVLDAIPAIAAADKVVVVDAMEGGGPPGSVYRVCIKDCNGSDPIGSVHGFDLKSALFMFDRETPPEVIVIGIEPEVVSWSTKLSCSVRAAFPEVITTVQKELSA